MFLVRALEAIRTASGPSSSLYRHIYIYIFISFIHSFGDSLVAPTTSDCAVTRIEVPASRCKSRPDGKSSLNRALVQQAPVIIHFAMNVFAAAVYYGRINQAKDQQSTLHMACSLDSSNSLYCRMSCQVSPRNMSSLHTSMLHKDLDRHWTMHVHNPRFANSNAKWFG